MCREGFSILIEHPAFVGRIAYIKVREAYLVFRKKGEVEKVRVEGALPLLGSAIGYHYIHGDKKTTAIQVHKNTQIFSPCTKYHLELNESLKPPKLYIYKLSG